MKRYIRASEVNRELLNNFCKYCRSANVRSVGYAYLENIDTYRLVGISETRLKSLLDSFLKRHPDYDVKITLADDGSTFVVDKFCHNFSI